MKKLLLGIFLYVSIATFAEVSLFFPSLKNQDIYEKLYSNIPSVETVQEIIETLPSDDPDRGYFEFKLIYAYWGEGNYKALDSTYLKVKDRFESSGNVVMSYNLDRLYNSILIYKGELSRGISSLLSLNDKIDVLLQRDGLHKDYLMLKFYVNYELSYAYNKLEVYEEADRYCQIATDIMEETYEVDPYIYNLHAIIKRRMTELDESIKLYDRALRAALRDNDSVLIRLVYHNIQNVYVEQDRSDMAMMFGRKIFEYNPASDTTSMPQHSRYVEYLVGYGKVLMQENYNQNAKDSLSLALRVLRPNTPDNIKQVLYLEYAKVLYKFHKNDSSAIFFEKSLSLISDQTPDENKFNLFALYGIKQKSDGLYDNAKAMLETSLDYYRDKGGILLVEVLEPLADLEYNHYNNPERAYKLLKEASEVRSKIYRSRYINRLSAFEAEYKTKDIESRLELANTRREITNTRYKYSLLLFILVIILVLFVFITVIHYYKKREIRFKNKQLELKLQISEADHRAYKITKDMNRKATDRYIKGLEDSNRHLSKELHDGICNKLLILQIQFKDKADKQLLQGITQIRDEVRSMSHQLATPEFRDIDIAMVLRDLVNRVSMLGLFDIDLYIDEETANSLEKSPSKLDLYRFLQEAISNIIKHSRAKSVSITLCNTNNMVDLVIEDDGIGFDVHQTHKSLGLHTMSERVEACQGVLEINSEKGKGTLIRATFK